MEQNPKFLLDHAVGKQETIYGEKVKPFEIDKKFFTFHVAFFP